MKTHANEVDLRIPDDFQLLRNLVPVLDHRRVADLSSVRLVNVDPRLARDFVASSLPWSESGLEFISRFLPRPSISNTLYSDQDDGPPARLPGRTATDVFQELEDEKGLNKVNLFELRDVIDRASRSGLLVLNRHETENGYLECYAINPSFAARSFLDQTLAHSRAKPQRHDLDLSGSKCILEDVYGERSDDLKPFTMRTFLSKFTEPKSIAEVLGDEDFYRGGYIVWTRDIRALFEYLLAEGMSKGLLEKSIGRNQFGECEKYRLIVDLESMKPI